MSSSQVAPAAVTAADRRTGGFVGDFFTGAGFLLRGLGMYARSPGLMLLGLLPALISFALLAAGMIAVFFSADTIAVALTPFADGWTGGLQTALRALVGAVVVLICLILSVLIFAALTLIVGEPFYEAISKRVDDRLGGVPGEIDVSFWKTLPRSVWESLRLLAITLITAVLIFIIGLIPVIGTVTAAILGAVLGGWALAVELTSVPFERRGLRLRDRRQRLRSRRGMALGFGMATFLCFLIPLGAVLVMPAAVAGSTLLTRRLFGQPDAAE